MPTVATTLNRMIERATVQLLDPGNVRWPRAAVVDYLNEALREVLAHRPDAFATTVDLPLRAGAMQQLPQEYASLSSIEQSMNERGVQRVREGDYKYYRLRTCPDAAPPRGFHVRTYIKHPIDDAIYYVEPPVPPDCRTTVLATVIRKPGNYDADEGELEIPIRAEFEAQVLDWVCFRCLSGDHESETARTQAKVHLESFIKLLGLKDKAALRYHNGMFDPTDQEMAVQRMGAKAR